MCRAVKSREVTLICLLRMKRNGGVIAQGIYSATVVILTRGVVQRQAMQFVLRIADESPEILNVILRSLSVNKSYFSVY